MTCSWSLINRGHRFSKDCKHVLLIGKLSTYFEIIGGDVYLDHALMCLTGVILLTGFFECLLNSIVATKVICNEDPLDQETDVLRRDIQRL